MRRTVKLKINYANTGKLDLLQSLLDESKRLINFYIDQLWEFEQCPKFCNYKDFEPNTWVSSALQSHFLKTALEVIRSQKNNKKIQKFKPVYMQDTLDLSSRFSKFFENDGLYDIFIRLQDLTPRRKKDIPYLPTKKHAWFNKYVDDGWKLKTAIKIKKTDKGWFACVVFEKDKELKPESKKIGIDCGYKHLAVTSEGQFVGSDLSKYAEKISRKQQGSKAFKRALVERNQYIHQEIKKLDLDGVSTVVVENLKNVKHKTKGRISKQFMNKLQRWNYRYFMGKLANTLEVVGVQLSSVNPAYTSQICSQCGNISATARNGEEYKCPICGLLMQADYNAAKNILNRFLGQEPIVSVERQILKMQKRFSIL